MNDLYIFIFFIGLLSTFFTYKIIIGVLNLYNYKKGYTIKAKVLSLEWVKTPPTRFRYLYPKEQLRVTFRFAIGEDEYKKTETDIHFKYKKVNYKTIPKEGGDIEVYVTKNEDPNKVTINNVNETIYPLLGLLLMVLFGLMILFLIIYNI